MATRSSTSEFQPSPPINRVGPGKVGARIGVRQGTTVNPGVKPNMGVAPATNGDRASGLAPSKPASTTKGLKMSPAIR